MLILFRVRTSIKKRDLVNRDKLVSLEDRDFNFIKKACLFPIYSSFRYVAHNRHMNITSQLYLIIDNLTTVFIDVEFKSVSLLSPDSNSEFKQEYRINQVRIGVGAIGPWIVRTRFLCLAVPLSCEYTLPFDVGGEDKARSSPSVSSPLLVFASNSPLFESFHLWRVSHRFYTPPIPLVFYVCPLLLFYLAHS